jgi:hypothetical protein
MGAFKRVPYAFFPKRAVAKTVVPRTDLLIAISSAMHLLSQDTCSNASTSTSSGPEPTKKGPQLVQCRPTGVFKLLPPS